MTADELERRGMGKRSGGEKGGGKRSEGRGKEEWMRGEREVRVCGRRRAVVGHICAVLLVEVELCH